MRIVVTTLDIILIGLLIYGIAIGDYDSLLLMILLILFIATNIYFINKHSQSKSWLNFYFKRKILEEKKKIDNLSSKE